MAGGGPANLKRALPQEPGERLVGNQVGRVGELNAIAIALEKSKVDALLDRSFELLGEV